VKTSTQQTTVVSTIIAKTQTILKTTTTLETSILTLPSTSVSTITSTQVVTVTAAFDPSRTITIFGTPTPTKQTGGKQVDNPNLAKRSSESQGRAFGELEALSALEERGIGAINFDGIISAACACVLNEKMVTATSTAVKVHTTKTTITLTATAWKSITVQTVATTNYLVPSLITTTTTSTSTSSLPYPTVTHALQCVAKENPLYPGYGPFLEGYKSMTINACGFGSPHDPDWASHLSYPRHAFLVHMNFGVKDMETCCDMCYNTLDCAASRWLGGGMCQVTARVYVWQDGLFAIPGTCPVSITPTAFTSPGEGGWLMGPCGFSFCSPN